MCRLDLGCRPEELLTLRVEDFERDSYGIRVHIRRSKTTRRSPHLSFSIPYVVRWLEVHPLRDDLESRNRYVKTFGRLLPLKSVYLFYCFLRYLFPLKNIGTRRFHTSSYILSLPPW